MVRPGIPAQFNVCTSLELHSVTKRILIPVCRTDKYQQMQTSPVIKKENIILQYFKVCKSTLLNATPHSSAFLSGDCTCEASWDAPVWSFQPRCLWTVSVYNSYRGSMSSSSPYRCHIISQILMKRANSVPLSATHSQDKSTLDTFTGSFRFSSFISTQQGMVPCKCLLIITYYKFKPMETCWSAPASNTWTLLLPQT